MAAKLLEGKEIAGKIKNEVKKEVEKFKEEGIEVSLHAVMIGDNPGSRVYARNQKKSAEEVGIVYHLHELPESQTQEEVIKFIEELNRDEKVNGIILQVPVPSHMNAREIQMSISPDKDAEGMNPYNIGLLIYGKGKLVPCTAKAAKTLLEATGLPLKGLEVTVVGHSEIVGKPLTLMLLESLFESPTPTVCHIATRDLSFHTKRADVLIVAVGKPGLIKGEMIKEGAVVIDIGINRVPVLDDKGNPVLNEKGRKKMKIVGDVVFEEAEKKASFITPVPGGVGPVTTAILLRNTLEAVKLQKRGK
ncbi:MAG: bifunctional 5,10-methylenetetrahydrofolate dehydrogenase/5,10-methenyltetrahydrofolate cyclohydrolase [Caldiserica bacterium]|nr:bifunctional 5,10-methylenetetrahydrofolate dehydrogenase/5,10-methenyltetrahydrofolate cyclohydrolase [Caldisericota bacterium]